MPFGGRQVAANCHSDKGLWRKDADCAPAKNKANFSWRADSGHGRPCEVAEDLSCKTKPICGVCSLGGEGLSCKTKPISHPSHACAAKSRGGPSIVVSSGAKRSRDIWHRTRRPLLVRPDPSTTLGMTKGLVCHERHSHTRNLGPSRGGGILLALVGGCIENAGVEGRCPAD